MRIGIDLGGTKIAAGIVDDSGKVIHRKRIATEKERGYIGIRGAVASLIDETVLEGGLEKAEIRRIGIACAGQIGRGSDRIIFSPNLNWHNVPLGEDIREDCGIETFVENDVNAATYGEWLFGFKEEPHDLLGVFLGTGIGGGLIIGRKLYRGFSNVGGEVGHILLNPEGYRCNCGNTGCFEAYCGGAHIVERVASRIREGYRGKIWDIIAGRTDTLHVGHIEDAFLLGDDFCGKIWQEVIEYMGLAMASLANLLNPEVMVFGGGVVYGTRYLVDEARSVMERRALAASLTGMRIEKARLGEDAAIVGAAFVNP
jgi:glucokinase